MKTTQHFTLLIILFAVLYSCKKDDINPDNLNNITLLNSNQWKVVASHIQKKQQGALGGGFGTTTFSLQKQDELRWYLYFTDMSSYQDPIEIVVNNQNIVTVNKPIGNTSTDFRPIKTIYGSDTWETHISFNNASHINVFKNGQLTDIGYPLKSIKTLQATEDGLLNNTDHYGSTNWVSHYHYGSGQWKDNSFWAKQYVATRYNDKTFVATLLNDGTVGMQGTFTVLEESNTPTSGVYPMTNKNEVTIPNAGYIIHSTRHNDNFFVAIDAHWQNKFVVYKVNLVNYSVQKVMEETKVENYANNAYIVRNLATLAEIDPDGNLYIVANRTENQQANYSIRKYKSTGGTEVILKETDLKENTQLHALKYFNSKLHAAVIYRQENPNDYTDNKYHFQIIKKN